MTRPLAISSRMTASGTNKELPPANPWPKLFRPPFRDLVPGLLLCFGIVALAQLSGTLQKSVTGQVTIEPLVVALLLGVVLTTTVRMPSATGPGVRFASRPVLNVAVAILGASVDLGDIADAGLKLVFLAVVVVGFGLAIGLALGKLLGLGQKLSVLVAVGNSICGNSAIAATAPAIGASREDVAASISLTAILGVLHVLAIPLVVGLFAMGDYRAGILVGLTVYSVPQVVAAAFPLGPVAVQVAVLVKLTRVVLLGPVVLLMSLLYTGRAAGAQSVTLWQRTRTAVPWFVAAFLLMAMVRTLGLIPDKVAGWSKDVSKLMFVVSMAGVGLEVQVAALRGSVPKVTVITVSSMVLLTAVSVIGMVLLGISV